MTDMSISLPKPTIPFTFPFREMLETRALALMIYKKINSFNWPTTFNCSIALTLTKLLEKNYSNPECYGMVWASPMGIILRKRNFPLVASQF